MSVESEAETAGDAGEALLPGTLPESLRAELVASRRDLHMHPELGNQEFRTTAAIKEREARKQAKKDPALRHASSALRAIDKALLATKDAETKHALLTARSNLAPLLGSSSENGRVRRSSAEIENLADSLLNYVRNNPGQRSEEIAAADYYPQPMEAFTFDGELMCLPQNLSSLVVYYNRDLFDAAGLADPAMNWTWDDFLAAAQALTRDTDGDGAIDQFGAGIEPDRIGRDPAPIRDSCARGRAARAAAIPPDVL